MVISSIASRVIDWSVRFENVLDVVHPYTNFFGAIPMSNFLVGGSRAGVALLEGVSCLSGLSIAGFSAIASNFTDKVLSVTDSLRLVKTSLWMGSQAITNGVRSAVEICTFPYGAFLLWPYDLVVWGLKKLDFDFHNQFRALLCVPSYP